MDITIYWTLRETQNGRGKVLGLNHLLCPTCSALSRFLAGFCGMSLKEDNYVCLSPIILTYYAYNWIGYSQYL